MTASVGTCNDTDQDTDEHRNENSRNMCADDKVCKSLCNSGALDESCEGTTESSDKYRTCTVDNCLGDPVIADIFTFPPFLYLKEYCEEAANDQGRERCADEAHNA